MLVSCTKDIRSVKISKPTRLGVEYVMLQDSQKKKVMVLECQKIC
jgi:hypothetical protein